MVRPAVRLFRAVPLPVCWGLVAGELFASYVGVGQVVSPREADTGQHADTAS